MIELKTIKTLTKRSRKIIRNKKRDQIEIIIIIIIIIDKTKKS
jgi:hypothetical protein